MQKVVCDGPG